MTEDTAPDTTDNAEASGGTDNAAVETKVETKAPVTTSEDWRSGFSDDLKGHASIAKFSSPETMAKSYINLERMLGGDKIAVPKSADDKESWDKVYKALGRPDDAKGYELQKPENLPEGMEYSDDLEAKFREFAFEKGLTQTQAQDLRDFHLANMVGEFTAGQTDQAGRIEEVMADLQREWGRATDQKIGAASHAAKTLGGEEFAAMLDETGLGNDPRLIRGFAKIAEKIGGDKGLLGEALTESTPGDLDASIAEYRANHRDALMDKNHPDHKTRLAGLTALYNKRHPEKAA